MIAIADTGKKYYCFYGFTSTINMRRTSTMINYLYLYIINAN